MVLEGGEKRTRPLGDGDREAWGGTVPLERVNTAVMGSGSACVVLGKKLQLPDLLLTYKKFFFLNKL